MRTHQPVRASTGDPEIPGGTRQEHHGAVKAILYAGASLRTADEVADAVLSLAEALQERGTTEAVTVPVVVDGVQGDCRLLLGRGIPIASLSLPADGVTVNVHRDGLVGRIRQRVMALTVRAGEALDGDGEGPDYDDFDGRH